MIFKKLFYKTINWGIGLSLLLFVLQSFYDPPYPPTQDIKPILQTAPIQQETNRSPFAYSHKKQEYFVEPLYKYELWGMIVSDNDEYSFWDKIFPILGARIKDVCVVWGPNVLDTSQLTNINFWNENYTCFYQTYQKEAFQWFTGNKLSNNHLIASDKSVIKSILRSQKGDQIYLKGVLATYGDNTTKRVIRTSSTTRDDTGNGACETIFVDEFTILKKNPTFLAFLFRNNSNIFWFLVILKAGLFFSASKKQRRPSQAR